MRFNKCIIGTILLLLSVTTLAFARDAGDISRHDEELNEEEVRLLREYLSRKREEEAEDQERTGKSGKHGLLMSGEVHVEWRNLHERLEGKSLRGGHAKDCRCLRIGHNDFDIEFDLRFDYRNEKTWARAHLQFDNSAGIDDVDCCCATKECEHGKKGSPCFSRSGRLHKRNNRFHGSGSCDDICLKRAYMGYNFFDDDCGRLDVELGRRMLYDVFESEIEFLDRFDGILVKYSYSWEQFLDWYVQFAGFLVDERVNHFAWAAEIGLFNILDTQWDFKYSIIDWRKRGFNRCGEHDPCGTFFLDSQVVITYHLDPELFWCKPTEVYAAGLYNHLARNSKKAWAAYAGITIGKVDRKGDWSIDVNYQYVKKDAIAWDDESGICLGNILEDCCVPEVPTTGYQGPKMEILYAITDNLVVDIIAEHATSTQSVRHRYSKFEIEFVYSF